MLLSIKVFDVWKQMSNLFVQTNKRKFLRWLQILNSKVSKDFLKPKFDVI